MLVPQLPAAEGQAPVESEAPDEVVERLAHLEQLVVQLKELVRDKDTQLIQKDAELANKDVQLKVYNLCVCQSERLLWVSDRYHLHVFSWLTRSSTFAHNLQNEKEEFEARFTKLKLQAKAKMASLNKQMANLKGQAGATVS